MVATFYKSKCLVGAFPLDCGAVWFNISPANLALVEAGDYHWPLKDFVPAPCEPSNGSGEGSNALVFTCIADAFALSPFRFCKEVGKGFRFAVHVFCFVYFVFSILSVLRDAPISQRVVSMNRNHCPVTNVAALIA